MEINEKTGSEYQNFSQWIQKRLTRSLVFVHGKGGVGKTAVSQAIAHRLSERGHKTLWVAFEDPIAPAGELRQITPTLDYLNCDFSLSFEEYVAMKIGAPKIARAFLGNKVIQYLSKAAPGIKELVLLGKVWFESSHYSHVVVDLPATGHGLALFQSTVNFSKLFGGGPLTQDAESMLETFSDPSVASHLIVSLPEEMPLRESLDLNQYLKEAFPKNPAGFMLNRCFPKNSSDLTEEVYGTPDTWPSPIARSIEDYAAKRQTLEDYNLRIWKEEALSFGSLDFVLPPLENMRQSIALELSRQLHLKNYL